MNCTERKRISRIRKNYELKCSKVDLPLMATLAHTKRYTVTSVILTETFMALSQDFTLEAPTVFFPTSVVYLYIHFYYG